MTGQVILNQTTQVIPINGTNAVQTLAIGGTPTAGAASSISLTWNGLTSIPALWSATNATLLANIQAALDGLFNSGGTSAYNCIATNSTLSSGVGNILITFQGSYAAMPQSLLVAVNNLTGTAPTAVVTNTTTGVSATNRQAAPGEQCVFTGANCTNTVMTITLAAVTSGTFTISGTTAQNTSQTLTTAAITWSATNATLLSNIQSATDTTFGTNNVIWYIGTAVSGLGTIIGRFGGVNGFSAVPLWTANGASLVGTGAAVSIALTTAGGATSTRTAPMIPYVNYSSTLNAPSWFLGGQKVRINMGSPALGTTLTLHTAADTGSDQTFTTFTNQPDVARCLVSTPSGTTANVTAVQDYVEGTDCNGNFISELLPAYTAGAATSVTSINAFLTVTKYIQKANGASVTITTKYSSKLGLGIPITLTGSVDAWLAGVFEATKPTTTVSTNGMISGNLITLSSALNGTAVIVTITPS
jgi:hypothetical protein